MQYAYISHTIGPSDLHLYPAPRSKAFQVFMICCPHCSSFDTAHSRAPNLAFCWFARWRCYLIECWCCNCRRHTWQEIWPTVCARHVCAQTTFVLFVRPSDRPTDRPLVYLLNNSVWTKIVCADVVVWFRSWNAGVLRGVCVDGTAHCGTAWCSYLTTINMELQFCCHGQEVIKSAAICRHCRLLLVAKCDLQLGTCQKLLEKIKKLRL